MPKSRKIIGSVSFDSVLSAEATFARLPIDSRINGFVPCSILYTVSFLSPVASPRSSWDQILTLPFARTCVLCVRRCDTRHKLTAKTTIKWPFIPDIHAQTETLKAPRKWQFMADCTKIRQILADCTFFVI